VTSRYRARYSLSVIRLRNGVLSDLISVVSFQFLVSPSTKARSSESS
jgi:hypothetical protein